MIVFLVGFPLFLFGRYVSSRQSTFGAKTVLAWFGVFITLFFGILVTNLNLGPLEEFLAFATAGFSIGLAFRLVRPSRSTGGTWPSEAAIERRQLEQKRNRKPDAPVRLPSTFNVNQLKGTCQREEFVVFALQHRLHWRTRGLLEDDASISNLLIAVRKLSAAVTDWNQMKSLLAICVFLGTTIAGTMWLNNVPVRWCLLLLLVATVLLFTIACVMHMYPTLNQPRPQDVVLDFESGLLVWKTFSGTNRRPLSDVQQFSVKLNGIPASHNGAALLANFHDDFSLAILETPRNIKPDNALAKLIPFARVLAETVGVAVQHEQFGRDHVADSYVKPWIPQSVLHPKYVLSVIAAIAAYYGYLMWPLLKF